MPTLGRRQAARDPNERQPPAGSPPRRFATAASRPGPEPASPIELDDAVEPEETTAPTLPPVPPIDKNPRIHPLLSKQIIDCVQLHPDDRPESMHFVANRLQLIGDVLESPKPVITDDDETQF